MSNRRIISFCLLLLALLCWLISLIAFYPGFMSPDSFDQYAQSLSHQYNDWHPPAMAFFWSLLNHVWKGPYLLLLFQLTCYWGSFYLIADAFARKKWYYALLVLVIFVSPFYQNFEAYIIKDSEMALSWLLACSILARARLLQRPLRRMEAIFSAVLLAYGTLVRINAFPAVVPLCVLWTMAVWPRSGNRQLIVRSILFFIVVAGLYQGLNWCLKPGKGHPEYKLYAQDITGILVKTGKSYFPNFISDYSQFDTGYLKTHYHPATFDDIWWNHDNKHLLPDLDEAHMTLLKESWERALRENAGVYLCNRYEGFLYYLRIKKRPVTFYFIFPYIHPNPYGFEYRRNAAARFIIRGIEGQKDMFYMQPWGWAILSLLLPLLSLFLARPPQRIFILLLSFSSLFYLLPQFFVYQVDTDFRYFYWNCINGGLVILLLVFERLRQKYHHHDQTPGRDGSKG